MGFAVMHQTSSDHIRPWLHGPETFPRCLGFFGSNLFAATTCNHVKIQGLNFRQGVRDLLVAISGAHGAGRLPIWSSTTRLVSFLVPWGTTSHCLYLFVEKPTAFRHRESLRRTIGLPLTNGVFFSYTRLYNPISIYCID